MAAKTVEVHRSRHNAAIHGPVQVGYYDSHQYYWLIIFSVLKYN